KVLLQMGNFRQGSVVNNRTSTTPAQPQLKVGVRRNGEQLRLIYKLIGDRSGLVLVLVAGRLQLVGNRRQLASHDFPNSFIVTHKNISVSAIVWQIQFFNGGIEIDVVGSRGDEGKRTDSISHNEPLRERF